MNDKELSDSHSDLLNIFIHFVIENTEIKNENLFNFLISE